MPNSDDERTTNFEQIITSEQIGFAPEELIDCEGCLKPNGPDRQKCLYCGHALPLTERNSAIAAGTFRRLESWEPGINVILTGNNSAINGNDIETAAKIVGMDASFIRSMIDARTMMPIARVENMASVESVLSEMSKVGLEAKILPDRELDADHPPIRLRSAEIEERSIRFTKFNSGGSVKVRFDEIALIVTGRIFRSRREEVIKRKRGETRVLEEFETSDDVGVMDIYSLDNKVGLRVLTNGFDFSVLGREKELLAEPNMTKLAEVLFDHSVNARFADEYDSVRPLLDLIWEPEFQKESHGLQMRGYGKREFGATFKSSNSQQFTKYSRMRRLMI